MTREASDHVTTLLDMHGYCRPAGSKTERKFIADYIRPLGVEQDKAGNLIKRIGDNPHVLWSCHTDTVHKAGGRQNLTITGDILTAVHSECLGADDTAGVWLMCEMIRAQRPGLYVFHREEEIGGGGSTHVSVKTPHLLKGIQAAIALDRKGTTSIITHQWGGRCASDAFAKSLDAALGGGFIADSGGTFTDTANYMEQVSECTNLSVGYYNQHTAKESLDLAFICDLRERLLALDTSKLVIERDPTVIDAAHSDVEWDAYLDEKYGDAAQRGGEHGGNFDRLVRLIERNPREVADFLDSMAIDAPELEHALWDRGAILDL